MNATGTRARAHPAPPELPAAGFWHRYAAWSLDATVLLAATMLLAWPWLLRGWHAVGAAFKVLLGTAGDVLAGLLMDGAGLPAWPQVLLHDPRLLDAAAGLQAALWQLAWPLLLGYALLAAPWHVLGEASRWQGSPGKRWLGLATTDLAGHPPSLPRAALRHVAGLLSWLTLNLGHLMAALPPRRGALHDLVAGMRVVRRTEGARLPGWARAWIVLQALAVAALLGWLLLRYVAALETDVLEPAIPSLQAQASNPATGAATGAPSASICFQAV